MYVNERGGTPMNKTKGAKQRKGWHANERYKTRGAKQKV